MLQLRLLPGWRRGAVQTRPATSSRSCRTFASGIWPEFWFLADGNESIGRADPLHFVALSQSPVGQRLLERLGLNHDAYKGVSDIVLLSARLLLPGRCRQPAQSPRRSCTAPTPPTIGAWGWPAPRQRNSGSPTQNNGPAVCKFVGERRRYLAGIPVRDRAGHVVGKTLHRRLSRHGRQRLGVYAHNFLCTAMQAVTFNMPQQEIRYLRRHEVRPPPNIHDDEFAPGKLEFAWTLTGPDGKTTRARHEGPGVRHEPAQTRAHHVRPAPRDGRNAIYARHGAAKGRPPPRAPAADH